MTGPEEDCGFECPFCGVEQSVRIDKTGGKRQVFVTDCENCCRPIEITAQIEADGYVNVSLKGGEE